MSMNKETVKRVARLSRIAVDDQQAEALLPRLQKIMGFVEQLQEVNTDDVEPLANVMDLPKSWRTDVVTDGGYPDEILANAPETTQNFFSVPKVVEEK